MYPSTNTNYVSIENIIIYKKVITITTSPSLYVTKSDSPITLTIIIKYPFDHFREHPKEINEETIADQDEKVYEFFEKKFQTLSLQFNEYPNKISSGTIQNEVPAITYKHPYYEDHFGRKLQDKISPYDQS